MTENELDENEQEDDQLIWFLNFRLNTPAPWTLWARIFTTMRLAMCTAKLEEGLEDVKRSG